MREIGKGYTGLSNFCACGFMNLVTITTNECKGIQ